MIQRGGEVTIQMVENVKKKTIEPIIKATIKAGTLIFTDEYTIYNGLTAMGCAGEYARDEDGDGFHDIQVNTMAGFWSLLRSWLRPHRGISQEKLPLYLSFFEYRHNLKKQR